MDISKFMECIFSYIIVYSYKKIIFFIFQNYKITNHVVSCSFKQIQIWILYN